jgi:pimeloyl-ACP methyl ester carboxylesterase
MVNWLVFGGWAVPPSVLKPVFGADAVYIDVNAIIPSLMNNGTLSDAWQQKLFDIVVEEPILHGAPLGIAGWSTGAMLAWTVAGKLKPAAGVFISATPSFCRRSESGFLSGQRSSVLKSMREKLLIDPDDVVEEFYRQCGIAIQPMPVRSSLFDHCTSTATPVAGADSSIKTPDANKGATCEQLLSGLNFLEQSTLLPVAKAGFPSFFIHGKNDTVIPIAAGRYFCTEAGGTFAECYGPHAFFLENPVELAKTITLFLQKAI